MNVYNVLFFRARLLMRAALARRKSIVQSGIVHPAAISPPAARIMPDHGSAVTRFSPSANAVPISAAVMAANPTMLRGIIAP